MTDGTHSPSRRVALGVAGGLALGAAGGAVFGVSSAPAPSVRLDGIRRSDGKAVLITGGTSGIGRATAEQFAREGARVAFCGRRQALGAQVEKSILAAGGNAHYLAADVRDERQVSHLVEAARAKLGGLDIVISNAGITIQKPLHEYSTADWEDVINTNLRGSFLTLKYAIPLMLNQGSGTILVTSSSVANVTGGNRSAYAATKAGLVGMVRSAAIDYAAKGLRINAILPGTTNTDLVRRAAGTENLPDSAWQLAAAQWGKANVPGMKRMAQPEEIAAFIVAMCSPDLTFSNGDALSCDGGIGAG